MGPTACQPLMCPQGRAVSTEVDLHLAIRQGACKCFSGHLTRPLRPDVEIRHEIVASRCAWECVLQNVIADSVLTLLQCKAWCAAGGWIGSYCDSSNASRGA